MAWEPVEDDFQLIVANPNGEAYLVFYTDISLLEVGMVGHGPGNDINLPDDIRLCRRVDAPAQGVQIPKEVAETILAALNTYMDKYHWMDSDVKNAKAWLAQVQGAE